jgi:hypothetical protein
MRIERRLAQGYEITCAGGHHFIARRLGPSVECPLCGETALTTEITTAYFDRPAAVGD